MKKLNLVYFGSPDFSADFLEKLITDTEINKLIEVKFVVTQPDQKVGRKQILTPTPVKVITEKYLRSENIFFEKIARGPHGGVAVEKNGIELSNIDLALTYAYGDLIPKEILSLPKYGFWNIHPSLLPKYRGPSPIASPLINGDKTTGVTIIKMDEEIDHGPIIAQESYTIKDTDYRTDLEKNLTDLGFEMFKSILLSSGSPIRSGMTMTPQQHQLATYTKKLSKEDGFIEISKLKDQISKNSVNLFNKFRGLNPWPGIWTILPNGKRLKLLQLSIINCQLSIESVQLEGKNEVDFETFNKAYKIF